jgi:hypothetical protein
MPETDNIDLSFPQRHWFLICIFVAILSPVVVNWVGTLAHKEAHSQSVEQTPVKGGSGGSTPAGGAVPAGGKAQPGSVTPIAPTNNNEVKDTSYKVAAPPQHK